MNNFLIAFIKDDDGYDKNQLQYLLTISLEVLEILICKCYSNEILHKDRWFEINNGKIAIIYSLLIEDIINLEIFKKCVKNINLELSEKNIEYIKQKINLQYLKKEDVFEDLMLTIVRYEFQKNEYEKLISYSRNVKINELYNFIYNLININNLVIQ